MFVPRPSRAFGPCLVSAVLTMALACAESGEAKVEASPKRVEAPILAPAADEPSSQPVALAEWPTAARMTWRSIWPTLGPLQSIALSSDGRMGWAIGPRGLLHLAGGRWTALELGDALESGGGLENWALSVSADAQQGWAIAASGSALVLRHGHWSPARARAPRATFPAIAVSGDGRTAWAWGTLGKKRPAGFHRWNGQAWQRAKLGDGSRPESIRSIALSMDGERGWAVGLRGELFRLDADRWRADPRSAELDDIRLFSVRLSADGQRGWAVGGKGHRGVALRIEGDMWRRAKVDLPAALVSLTLTQTGDSGWSCGMDRDSCMAIDAGRWVDAHKLEALPHAATMALATSGDGRELWGVGMAGAPLNLRAHSSKDSGLRPFEDLHALAIASDAKTGWAVGDRGQFARLREGEWIVDREASGLTESTLRSVVLSGTGRDGWAAGDDCTLLRYRAGSWKLAPLAKAPHSCDLVQLEVDPSGEPLWVRDSADRLYALHETPERTLQQVRTEGPLTALATSGVLKHAWAIGRGRVWELRGDTWTKRERLGGDLRFAAMALDARGERGWAFGQGIALRLHQGAWVTSDEQIDPTWQIFDLDLSPDGQHAWAVGDVIIYFEAGRWRLDEGATSNVVTPLEAVAISRDGQSGWAVGQGGQILQLGPDAAPQRGAPSRGERAD